MKRHILISCLLLILFLLAGCEAGRGEGTPEASDRTGAVSGDPYAVDMGNYYGDLPGGIQPAVRVGGKNYYFSGASQVIYGTDTPEGEVYSIGNGDTYLPEGYTPVGEISSVTDGPLSEELQFRVGCNASGTVYTSVETPEVVYVHLLADWFSVQEPMYFRFISEEMKDKWILYGGNRYLISIGTGECDALEELSAGCEKVGVLTYIGIDKIPENDLETNCPNDSFSKALMGRDVYFDPAHPEFLYVYEHHYWAQGDYPTYLACPIMKAETPIEDSVVIDLYGSAEDYETQIVEKSVVLVQTEEITRVTGLLATAEGESTATSQPMDFPRFVVSLISADGSVATFSADHQNCLAGGGLNTGNHLSTGPDFYGQIAGIVDELT